MKIAVFNENCLQAGQRAWKHEQDEDWECGDIRVFEGTKDSLSDHAAVLVHCSKQHGCGTGQHMRKVAKTIREAIGEEPTS